MQSAANEPSLHWELISEVVFEEEYASVELDFYHKLQVPTELAELVTNSTSTTDLTMLSDLEVLHDHKVIRLEGRKSAPSQRLMQPLDFKVIFAHTVKLPAVDQRISEHAGLWIWALFAAVILTGLGLYLFKIDGQWLPVPTTPMGAFALTLLVYINTFVHELGHLASLYVHRVRSAALGLGLLFALPVAFCDVTNASHLSKPAKIQVYMAGSVAELLVASILFLVLPDVGNVFSTLLFITLLSALSNLLPLHRNDGYWIFYDIFGFVNIFEMTRSQVAQLDAGASMRIGLIVIGLTSALSLAIIIGNALLLQSDAIGTFEVAMRWLQIGIGGFTLGVMSIAICRWWRT